MPGLIDALGGMATKATGGSPSSAPAGGRPIGKNYWRAPDQFKGTEGQGLDKYRRTHYGYDPGTIARFFQMAGRESHAAGEGYANQGAAGLLSRGMGNSAAVRNAGRGGQQIRSNMFENAVTPFMQQEQRFAEGQRASDIGYGQQLWSMLSGRDMDLRRTALGRDLKPRDSIGFSTPFGGISIPYGD